MNISPHCGVARHPVHLRGIEKVSTPLTDRKEQFLQPSQSCRDLMDDYLDIPHLFVWGGLSPGRLMAT